MRRSLQVIHSSRHLGCLSDRRTQQVLRSRWLKKRLPLARSWSLPRAFGSFLVPWPRQSFSGTPGAMTGGAKLLLAAACLLATFIPLCLASPKREYNTSNISLFPSRWRRQACGSESYTCKSGSCIDSDRACDGVADCDDKSDETAENCLNTVTCPSYAYKCAYGGCVDADARCNGRSDCADGSDESNCDDKPGQTPVNCKNSEFKCKSGDCIDDTFLCDGAKDCKDGSDETQQQCSSVKCPTYSFQCIYGACIDGDGRCDGRPQCADGSDERQDLCPNSNPTPATPRPTPRPTPATPRPTPPHTTSPKPSVNACKLPQYPKNGRYDLGGCSTTPCPGPGSVLDKTVILMYKCDDGFTLEGNNIAFCESGVWSPLPSCLSVVCDPVVDHSLAVKCMFENRDTPCDKPMQPGTEAILNCRSFYILPVSPGYSKITCQSNGKWDKDPYFKCIPECGKRNPEGVPFIHGGYQAKKGEFPWHVGIYQDQGGEIEQICGGTLISPTVIVTAAHCFYDDANDRRHDLSLYKVAAGKYLRNWGEKNKYIQIGKIKDIVLEDRYRGSAVHYANDIAVVILEVSFQMSLGVRIACVDWQSKYDERQVLVDGNPGVVVGWGIKEGMVPSEELIAARLPFRTFDHCFKEVPETFQPFLTSDKFCAGHRNGTSVCPGDSGGGLAFEQNDNTGSTWYLRGIVSVGVTKGLDRCFAQQYAAFTKVSDYYNFLNKFT